MRKTLVGMIGAALVLLGGASPAFADTGFLVTYYADPGHTVAVGYLAHDCAGGYYVYGSMTAYSDTKTWAC